MSYRALRFARGDAQELKGFDQDNYVREANFNARSLSDLLSVMGELKAKGVDLYLHQQSLDTSTPAGKAMFQMLGVFSEFEREIIRERVNSGLARAKAQGKKLGRPRRDTPKRLAAIRKLRKRGIGINKIASKLGIGVSVVQRVLSGNP